MQRYKDFIIIKNDNNLNGAFNSFLTINAMQTTIQKQSTNYKTTNCSIKDNYNGNNGLNMG